MMLDIAGLVARHCAVPAAEARELSVAFIRTTTPTFLVCSPVQAHPRFVVKVGQRADLERRAVLMARLFRALPATIAEPCGVFALDGPRAIMIERGLPGVPWFRIGDLVQGDDGWRRLADRCIAALAAFQAAVGVEPDWCVDGLRPGDELRRLVRDVDEALAPLGTGTAAAVAGWAATLDDLGPIGGTWQHGDFVLNNMMVGADRLGVFDLEDFGKWRMPFVDAFALGCSLHLHASSQLAGWRPLAEDLAACAAADARASCTPRQKCAFFVHFLLAAISDTLRRPARAAIRLTYLEHLRDVLAHAERYEHAFEQVRPGGSR